MTLSLTASIFDLLPDYRPSELENIRDLAASCSSYSSFSFSAGSRPRLARSASAEAIHIEAVFAITVPSASDEITVCGNGKLYRREKIKMGHKITPEFTEHATSAFVDVLID
ncbi:hypothetical protein [Mesorhizobium sp. SP-1A]|uniref:hypothetical protein n=1 Tax=Mesorhizobium sp. SP-1A TaxID=3077840 RepID=UPI0028F6C1CC|nr:hypothetical protein [Mesorhizobium sp. SP-1A]